jgi:hypothetical protein
MTRSELIARLAARFPQLTTKDAELAVKAILDSLPLIVVAYNPYSGAAPQSVRPASLVCRLQACG